MSTMQRRHSTGEQGRPVWHADRNRDIEVFVSPPTFRDHIDIRGFQDTVAHAGQVIGALLISYDDKEIWFFGRQSLVPHRRWLWQEQCDHPTNAANGNAMNSSQ
mgnify:CR=1 FL=1